MRLEIPVTPDAETAQEWARDELAKPEYAEQGTSWFEQFVEWVRGLFDTVGNLGSSANSIGTIVIVLVAIAIVVVVMWLVLGPLRRARRATLKAGMLDNDARSSAQMREAALAAQAAKNWDVATMEWYRASVRKLEERGRIAELPGATAREAAISIGAAVPAVGGDAVQVANNFDVARYGAGGLVEADAAHARGTYEALARPLSPSSREADAGAKV